MALDSLPSDFSLVMQWNRSCYRRVFCCLKMQGTRFVYEFWVGFLFKCGVTTDKSANPFQTVFFLFLILRMLYSYCLSQGFYLPCFLGNVLRQNRSRNESSNTEKWTGPFFPLD